MTFPENLGSEILSIEGVRGFVILTPEGQLVSSQNVPRPDTCATSLALCVMGAVKIRQLLGFTRMRQVLLLPEGSDEFLVLPLKEHVVAILKSPGGNTEELVESFKVIVKNAYER